MKTLELSTDSFAAQIAGRSLYHVTPLHYLPSILAHHKLISAEQGAQFGILPRQSASRRDKMLGLNRYVHFSFDLLTPLLLNKLGKGMPHCTLEFDAEKLDRNALCERSLLPFNTKAWRSRADAAPIFKRDQMSEIIHAHDQLGRYPSLEYLVRDCVELDCLRSVITFCERDHDLVKRMMNAFAPGALERIILSPISRYRTDILASEVTEYIERCVATTLVQKLPRIPFD
jgi:hypothetical protein